MNLLVVTDSIGPTHFINLLNSEINLITSYSIDNIAGYRILVWRGNFNVLSEFYTY